MHYLSVIKTHDKGEVELLEKRIIDFCNRGEKDKGTIAINQKERIKERTVLARRATFAGAGREEVGTLVSGKT